MRERLRAEWADPTIASKQIGGTVGVSEALCRSEAARLGLPNRQALRTRHVRPPAGPPRAVPLRPGQRTIPLLPSEETQP